MHLRVALVTPFAWSQPHEVNAHVAGLAEALRARAHDVTVIAPSTRGRDLLDGRRALRSGTTKDVIAVGPSIPISRRSHMGVPVGVRVNLELALGRGAFDVIHGFEPGLPSISHLALTTTDALAVATFFSRDRLGYPARRSQRDLFRGRVDALLATNEEVAAEAGALFPGDYRVIPIGVDTDLFRPATKRDVAVLELEPAGRGVTRAVLRSLHELDGWTLDLVHTKPLAFRPTIPRTARGRVRVRSVRTELQRVEALSPAAVLVPAPDGDARLRLEAQSCAVAIVDPAGVEEQSELAAAALARLADDPAYRTRLGDEGRHTAERQSFARVAEELEEVYTAIGRKRRPPRHPSLGGNALGERDWIVADLHMHTRWSHDCSIEVDDLLAHAEEIGLGTIAVTDHNAFGGALEAVEKAKGSRLVVIPGEEIKTDVQGEVIGLFLQEEIQRGMSLEQTIAAIRNQGGLVYLPHPFDRMHAIPDPLMLHRHVAEVDVLEVFNARLLRDTFNDEALRFARKYALLQGAGSDAHVLQGVGTGALRMRRFRGPREFLVSLNSAEVLRRPKSLAYLQSLKWAAQVKEKVR